mmetsp:Transcript_60302/g.111854  ORF Transcript_60302/g.111854 Transcript_60302/m.111854 type:complete len:205 (-) Transcript_60302:177-791(-)
MADAESSGHVEKDGCFYDPELAAHGGPFTSKFEIGQVTIRSPLPCECLPLAAILLSFLPWVAPAAAVIYACFGAHPFLGIYAVIICVTSAVLSEVVLKPVIGEPRPATSAVRTTDGKLKNGMPSGHVLNWQALSTWLLLEIYMHASVKVSLGLTGLLGILMILVPWARCYNGDHTSRQVLVAFGIGLMIGLIFFGVRIFCFPEA